MSGKKKPTYFETFGIAGGAGVPTGNGLGGGNRGKVHAIRGNKEKGVDGRAPQWEVVS